MTLLPGQPKMRTDIPARMNRLLLVCSCLFLTFTGKDTSHFLVLCCYYVFTLKFRLLYFSFQLLKCRINILYIKKISMNKIVLKKNPSLTLPVAPYSSHHHKTSLCQFLFLEFIQLPSLPNNCAVITQVATPLCLFH